MPQAVRKPGKKLGWVAIPGAGIALAIWSMTAIGSIYSVGTSSHAIPQDLLAARALDRDAPAQKSDKLVGKLNDAPTAVAAQSVLASMQVREALFRHECDTCAPLAPLDAETEDAMHLAMADSAPAAPRNPFDSVVAKAALSPGKIAEALAQSRAARSGKGERMAVAELPAAGPLPDRFGPRIVEGERSSRLALALASAMPEDGGQETATDDLLAPPLPTPAPDRKYVVTAEPPVRKRVREQAEPRRQLASLPRAERMASLPGVDDQPITTVPRTRQSQTEAATASSRSNRSSSGYIMAYAKPDSPIEEASRSFRSLFSAPSRSNGVAVYDISAKTVYLPDGQRLEAHSGMGGFADRPGSVAQKNRGATPPNTYRLSMRESRFHGVEAIRLTPVDGRNKYGRDGLLAHTYMLRGRRAESNGCVVFKDYNRFLSAFKKGKIKQLVVVPGNGARIASNGSGA